MSRLHHLRYHHLIPVCPGSEWVLGYNMNHHLLQEMEDIPAEKGALVLLVNQAFLDQLQLQVEKDLQAHQVHLANIAGDLDNRPVRVVGVQLPWIAVFQCWTSRAFSDVSPFPRALDTREWVFHQVPEEYGVLFFSRRT